VSTVRLGVTLGDPAGIGPELAAAAWAAHQRGDLPGFTLIGPRVALPHIDAPWVDTGGSAPVTPGDASARAAAAALEAAAALALDGSLDAIITAPVAKSLLYAIGFKHPGQTEFFAAACGVDPADTAMLLAGPELRTVPATIHIPLSQVPQRLSADLLLRQARVLDRALRRDFALAAPRLAVAGLNPHAGENGSLGHEDRDLIGPVVQHLRAEGIDARGPLPADTLFSAALRPSYDAVLAMYHDQALIPVKALAMDETVNMTLGLPILRTSPDHGTAFDIAGKGIANPSSFFAAIRLADACARNRAHHG
jgi:4-hydroxythreonine-4-phosphate dehydrogenase